MCVFGYCCVRVYSTNTYGVCVYDVRCVVKFFWGLFHCMGEALCGCVCICVCVCVCMSGSKVRLVLVPLKKHQMCCSVFFFGLLYCMRETLCVCVCVCICVRVCVYVVAQN